MLSLVGVEILAISVGGFISIHALTCWVRRP